MVARGCFPLIAVSTTLALASVAVGQTPSPSTSSPGIAVVGVGEKKARPNVMEIDLNISGAAELSADAQVKFRDAKRRVHEAFAALKMKDLAIVEKGVSVTSADAAERMQMMWRGMPSTGTSKNKVAINGTLQLRLAGIRDLPPEKLLDVTSKLLDTARDSGANIGPSAEETANAYRYGGQMSYTMVRFVLEDSGDLQKQAYQYAVAQAHGKARQLAELYGVKLGQVLTVEDASSATAQTTNVYVYGPRPAADAASTSRVVSDKFSEIPIAVRLQVRFSIQPGAAAPPAKEQATR